MKLLLLGLFSFTLVGASAQDSLYSKVFYLPSIDIHTASVHPDHGDGLLISGNTLEDKGFLLSTDSLGNERWKERLTAQAHSVFVSEAIMASDSSYLVAGSALDQNTSIYSAFLTKTDPEGNIEWSRSLTRDDQVAKALSVIETLDSAYVVAGISGTNALNFAVFIAKIDRDGNLLWSNVLEGTAGNNITAIRQAADSSFYLAGNTSSSMNPVSDGLLINVSKTGTLNWSKYYANLPGNDMEMANDGVFILCKNLVTPLVALMKCDLSGANLWLKSYSQANYYTTDSPVKMAMVADSSFVVTYGSPFAGHVLKLDMNGDFAEGRDIQLNSFEVARSKNKGAFIVGDGPLWGIKSFVSYAHIGVMRMDSTLEGEDCVWGDIINTVVTTNPPAANYVLDASGELEISNFTMVAEQLDLLNFMGCVDQMGGIDENEQSLGLTVYPNSSSGIFNFTQEAQDQIQISVYSMNGQEIFSVKSASMSTQIDLSKFSGGMYFYKATDANRRSASGKIILE